MKYPLLALLLSVQMAWAQKTRPYQKLVKLVGAPPGTVLVQDSLFIDEAEAMNIHWLEYLHFLRKDSTEIQYQTAKPDSLAWAHEIAPGDPYVAYYLRHPGFRFFPVVGISYKQALNYCRWRTATVNQTMHSKEYLRKHPKLQRYDFRVVYRLPTVREWELAAGGINPVQQPYGGIFPPVPGSKEFRQQRVRRVTELAACLPQVKAADTIFRVPFNVQESYYVDDLWRAFTCPAPDSPVNGVRILSSKPMLTEYTYSNPPNARHLYNMIGNVAELTATPGIAKGGSWKHSVKEITVQTNFPYAEPQAWLGFRCAATVYISPRP